MKKTLVLLLITLFALSFCTRKSDNALTDNNTANDSIIAEEPEAAEVDTVTPEEIEIGKELLYDQHTLEDTYPYKDTTRSFQWDKMKVSLAHLETLLKRHSYWGVSQNYNNRNGEAPLVKEYHRNVYKRISDSYDVERYQSVPLFALNDTATAERYGRDGTFVKYLEEVGNFVKVEAAYFEGEWLVPKKYIQKLSDTIPFHKTIFVDVTNQNIATLEKTDSKWMVRSMNPATTGLHRPPYQQETPLGIFLVQEHKQKMIFLKDGSTETGGFAPWASRFCNGGYIHGVPVNAPRTALIEFSPSLGTTPRSHMCVRNATSHAKFVYDWATPTESLVFVLD